MVYRALMGRFTSQTPNTHMNIDTSEYVGAKLHVREGKSPDHKLRSLNLC